MDELFSVEACGDNQTLHKTIKQETGTGTWTWTWT
jgi:hypothetical protein